MNFNGLSVVVVLKVMFLFDRFWEVMLELCVWLYVSVKLVVFRV